MGQAILAVAGETNTAVVAAVDVGDDPAASMDDVDVAVDFSSHEVTPAVAAAAAAHGKPFVIGTTGHTQAETAAVLESTKQVPVVWAGNFSVGVNLLFYLTRKAAQILDADYHPEIVEMHHRHKKDAPSGTAERLIELILEARGLTREQVRHGREGLVGERASDELGVHALRGGSVVGDHTIIFAGEGERFELAHKAADRRIFALGALRAARWVLGQSPGLYRMEDVLGLK